MLSSSVVHGTLLQWLVSVVTLFLLQCTYLTPFCRGNDAHGNFIFKAFLSSSVLTRRR